MSTIRHSGEDRRRHSPLDGRYATKVTDEHRLAAHILHERGLSIRHIGRRLDLHHATVSAILREPFDATLARALHDPEVLELAAADREPD